jgi:hypothetical protein
VSEDGSEWEAVKPILDIEIGLDDITIDAVAAAFVIWYQISTCKVVCLMLRNMPQYVMVDVHATVNK